MFTRRDLEQLSAVVVEAWREGADGDWSAKAGTLEWTCTDTADHAWDAVLAVAIMLATRKQDGYPEWGGGVFTVGDDKRPEYLIEALSTATRLLSGVVAGAEPGATSTIWRRPSPEVRPAADFAPRGALELVLHGHDVCRGLGVALEPPADICARLRDHTVGWPHWTSPGWSVVAPTDDPWGDLLRASGRSR